VKKATCFVALRWTRVNVLQQYASAPPFSRALHLTFLTSLPNGN
jgi:hypothetical protein